MYNTFAGCHSKTIPCNGTIRPMVTGKIQPNRTNRIKLNAQLLFCQCTDHFLVGRYRRIGNNKEALR